MCTVTYGTAPGSFLATYCLEVLGRELENSNFEAGNVIRNHFYVDDLLTGADSEDELIENRAAIHKKLLEAKFPLRKYSSNSKSLLSALPQELLEANPTIYLSDSKCVNTLGIKWNPTSDFIDIAINPEPLSTQLTKRKILSFIAKQFDPLGLLSPITIRGKLIVQELWKLGVKWDEPIPDNVAVKFRDYYSDMCCLKDYSVARYVGDLSERKLYGFCDASLLAYCAVVYAVSNGHSLR